MWDTVLVVLVGVLYAVVFVIAALSLVAVPVLVVSSWIARRHARSDLPTSGPEQR